MGKKFNYKKCSLVPRYSRDMSSAKNIFRALPSTYALPNPTVDRASYRYARVTLLARECTVQALFSTGITTLINVLLLEVGLCEAPRSYHNC